MSDWGPIIGKEDVFEGRYRDKFRLLVGGVGEFVEYERDRVAIDIGVHLTAADGPARRPTHTRVWFQLKGVHRETLSLGETTSFVSVTVALEHLKFWFASPEPIYLAVYIECADKFLAEDVRDEVYHQWGEEFLNSATFATDQQTITVKIRADAVITEDVLTMMRRHQSMRIDGPFFRGRALGHRLDPLRCSLPKLDPSVYVNLVQRLLAVHNYRVSEVLDPAVLFGCEVPAEEHIVLSVGRLYNTFEWVPQLFTEFGIGPEDDFREEGTPEFAHGDVAVCGGYG